LSLLVLAVILRGCDFIEIHSFFIYINLSY
jgi:hypothetical protein